MNEDDVLWTVKDVAAFLKVPERKIWNRLRTTRSSWGIPRVWTDTLVLFLARFELGRKDLEERCKKLTPEEELRLWREINTDSGATA